MSVPEHPFATRPIVDLQMFKGVPYPADVCYQRLLITGPPGTGKSTHVRRIRGWFEEGYIDLSQPRWWTSRDLAMRPREVHLGFPFNGFERALSVFDAGWLNARPRPLPDLRRILLPPTKKHWFSVNWRGRYVFEFLLPDAAQVLEWRRRRAAEGTHPVDFGLDRDQIERQLQVFRHGAWALHGGGVRVILRAGSDAPPRCFDSAPGAAAQPPP